MRITRFVRTARLFRPRHRGPVLTTTMNCTTSSTVHDNADLKEGMQDSVKNYYGKVLQTSKDLKTSACTVDMSESAALMANIPKEVNDKFYGCGNPIPRGIEGACVLDLGSGSGRDVFLAAQLVGKSGKVIGIDMTDEQLAVARKNIKPFAKNIGWEPDLKFVKGYIEDIEGAGVDKNSCDIIMSNCVINLSKDKPAVLQGCYNVLRWGGEMHFADVYSDRRLSEEIRNHDVLVGECIGGALYTGDFERICKEVGFGEPQILSKREILVEDPSLRAILGLARFYSITYRLFKLRDMEPSSEDYGQVAYYKGTIPEYPFMYELANDLRFETNRPVLVDGNVASIVGKSWFGRHFRVVGDKSVHFGAFSQTQTAAEQVSVKGKAAESDAGCCPEETKAPEQPAKKKAKVSA